MTYHPTLLIVFVEVEMRWIPSSTYSENIYDYQAAPVVKKYIGTYKYNALTQNYVFV